MWPYPRHNLALAYAESGDYAAAAKEYLDAIAIAPNQPYLYYNLGLLYERSNQTRLARRAYEGALQSLTRLSTVYNARSTEWARELPRDGDLAKRRANAAAKATAVVQNALGSLTESERNPPAAAAHYEEAIRIDPSLCAARHNLALLKQKWPRKRWSGDSATPVELYRENLSRCPSFWPSLLQLAIIDLSGGDVPKAKSELQTVLSQVPDNRDARKRLAAVLVRQNEIPAAIALLTAAIDEEVRQNGSRGSADPALYELLGDAYTAANDPRACEAFRSALAAARRSAYSGDRRALRRKANCR
jgi:Tfp pilus assembly protein PilF